jgi:hypothetical protein
MSVPFKKRRIVLPQHMEVTPEPVTSAAADADSVSTETSSSSNKQDSKFAAEAVLVGTKLDYVKAMIKSQEILIARTTMQVFETCESQAQAELSIRSIRDLFMREAQDEERIATLSRTYVQLDAVAKILKAMVQWKDSLKFVSLSTDVLKVLLFHNSKARKSFLQLGGTHILSEACQNHWFLPMSKAALGALANVAPFMKNVPQIEEAVAFVAKAMRVFDNDGEIQRLGTYFCLALAASITLRRNAAAATSNCYRPEAVSSSSSALKRKLEPCH